MLAALLTSFAILSGDTTIPGFNTSPLSGPSQQFSVVAGLATLAATDPGTAQAIADGVASGALSIATLDHPTLAGATDGNTISIGLDDNPSLEMIAERLFHEFGHYRDGVPSGPHNGGSL